MMTTKTAKKQLKSIKKAAVVRMDHITTKEKIAGAAAIGVAVGVAATAIGNSLLHANISGKAMGAKKSGDNKVTK
jgi:F0F1-type ATP synthase membrane subunit c/vacuolar-type H+-ATPase subunit K